MARIKIDYGIYLGLEYACICRMERGVPVIKKCEDVDDSIPCCVFFNRRGGVVVGASAYRSMKSTKGDSSNAFIGFQRTMGTDKVYHSKNMEDKGLKSDYTSEELSAEVLKALKSFVTDEDFQSAVITIPTKFTGNQKNATKQAAKLAGIEQCELLQESIAASMAYWISSNQENCNWMFFDFGGEAFSTSLLKNANGTIQVIDTEGDNYLGGKNLDYAIVDDIIIPYLKENYAIEGILTDEKRKEVLRDAMKTYAEELKNKLSFQEQEDIISNFGELGEDDDGEEIELDLTVTQQQAFDVMRPHFQKAVNICKTLLERNSMRGSQLNKIIMVGGPTHSPLIRQMLKEQITENVDTSIDSMTAVACGAALYASTIDAEVKDSDVEIGTIRLNVGYESSSVEASEWVSVQLDKAATGPQCPDKVYVVLESSDKTWSSGKTEIDTKGNVIEANLKEGIANSFSILAYDEQGTNLECFPNEITIIQGSKVGAAPLPYFIGIEMWDDEKKKLVFEPIEGLEKNKPLPATGILFNLKTAIQLRPGNANDRFVLPIYQADEFEQGVSSKLYEYVADIIIDGSDVNQIIPADSSVDIIIRVDSSEMMTWEAYFPSIDVTVSKELKTDKKQGLAETRKTISDNFAEAERTIKKLEKEGVDVTDLRTKLEEVRKENENNTESKMVLHHQKEVMREIEKRDSGSEFDRLEKELKRVFKMTEEGHEKYGNFQTEQTLDQLRPIVDEAIARRDVKKAKDVLEQIEIILHKLYHFDCAIDYVDVTIEEGKKTEEKYACVLLPYDCKYEELKIQFYNTSNHTWASCMEKVNKLGNVMKMYLPNGISILEIIAKDNEDNYIQIKKQITINN